MRRWTLLPLLLFVVWACDSSDKKSDDPVDTTVQETESTPDAAAEETVAPSGEDAVVNDLPGALDVVEDLGPIEPQPPEPPAYKGTCPNLVAGTNTIMAAGKQRSFELFLPSNPVDSGAALVFVWHGNGDTGKNLANFFLAQQAADEYNAIIAAPSNCCTDGHDDCCDFMMTWNMGAFSDNEADLAVFDSILACVDEKYNIDNRRVYTTGFSAGSLWSTYLVVNRGEYLASAAIFSGGTGTVVTYKTPGNTMPVLVAWGGSSDVYAGVVDFEAMSLAFSENLRNDGHFAIECNHGLGHTVPYGGPTWGYKWLFGHQWGDQTSPFAGGLTDDFPSYCVIPE